MTQAVEQIIAQIDALSVEERGELVYAVLSSLEPFDEISQAWEAEVRRRINEVREKKVQGIPGRELFAELRQRSRA